MANTKLDLRKTLYYWDKKERTISVDCSDIPDVGNSWPDEILVTGKTGLKFTFSLPKVHRDGTPDNEITHVSYTPREMACGIARLEVFND